MPFTYSSSIIQFFKTKTYLLVSLIYSSMVPELQTPQVTQIQVRVDCNGCVRKIKKALNGINGIHDFYVDFPRQKLTIIGWADPEKIVKAIKKTRKNATIFSIIEPTLSPSKPTEPEPKGNAPAPDATQKSPAEAPPAQAAPPAEALPEATPSPTLTENNASQRWQSTPGTHDQPNYVNRFSSGHSNGGHLDRYQNSPVFQQEPPQAVDVRHSYNTYVPSHFVTEYENVRSPPRHTHYNRMEHYSGDYHIGNGNITSMFSDDNPNACSIV